MSVLQGKFLLAAPGMTDPNFRETVVLLVEHGDSGAMGLILNRPTDAMLQEAVSPAAADACLSLSTELVEAVVHHGGPCPGPLMLVHDDGGAAQCEVLPGLYFSAEEHFVQPLIDGSRTAASVRCFAGYAGWAPGQLEQELLLGGWIVADADAASVLATDSEHAWYQLISDVRRSRLLADVPVALRPTDPKLN